MLTIGNIIGLEHIKQRPHNKNTLPSYMFENIYIYIYIYILYIERACFIDPEVSKGGRA